MELFLGIDIGTSGARTGIFDKEGTSLIFCEELFSLSTPPVGLGRAGSQGLVERGGQRHPQSYSGRRFCPRGHQGYQL